MKTNLSLFLILFPFCLAFSQGWTKLSTTGAITARTNASAIYMPAKNSMVVFGGLTTTGHSNEIWSLNLNTNIWSLIPGKSAKVPDGRYTHAAMYDTTLDRLLIWSGQGSVLYNDVWAFNFADSTWQELFQDGNVAGAPLKRYGNASVFDPVSRNIVNFAGFTTSGRFDDTWVFNVDTKSWTDKTNAYFPLKRCLTSQSFAADRRAMIVYGGQSKGNLNDIWTLNLDTYSWTNLTPSQTPAGRHFSSNVYGGNGHVVIFGGDSLNQENTAGAMDDLWTFSLETKTWSRLPQGSSKPEARYGHTAIYISSQDKMIVFGGVGGALYNDTWIYSELQTVLSTGKTADPSDFFLQCFPNPSNGNANVNFYLKERSIINFIIQDIRGAVLAMPVNAVMSAGEHTFDLSTYRLSSGIYIGTLTSDRFKKSVKFVVE